MPIVSIIKRASSLILGADEHIEDTKDVMYEDNEVLFCKNNICVHPPAFARQESDILHYPGYLTVTTKTFIDQYNNAKRPTLLLTWIPNATLRKCPSTIENVTHHRQISEEPKQNKLLNLLSDKNGLRSGSMTSLVSNNTNPFLEPYFIGINEKKCNGLTENVDEISISSSSDKASITNSISTHSYREDAQSHSEVEDEVFIASANTTVKEDPDVELQPLLENETNRPKTISQQSVTSVNITIANPRIQNHDISPTESVHQNHENFLRTASISSTDDNSPNWMTPELFAYKHNLSFPESTTASPVLTRKTPLKCRR